MKKNILFIINPISGGKNKEGIRDIIDKYLDKKVYDAQYVFTKFTGHATVLAAEAVANHTDIIIAVGGDGTINEIASVVANSNISIGIVAYGSGNGLARSLNIPLAAKDAILLINRGTTKRIDSAIFDDKRFFNMSGLGFDAHISALFAKDKTRGLIGYIKTTLKEISNYQAQDYRIEIDGNIYNRNAFMLSVANSSQFGNNAHVSPHASLVDGLLDVCIIKPFPLYSFPGLAVRMFTRTAHRSKYVEIIKGKEIRIKRQLPGPVHLDGEPFYMDTDIKIAIQPLSVSVLV